MRGSGPPIPRTFRLFGLVKGHDHAGSSWRGLLNLVNPQAIARAFENLKEAGPGTVVH